ncbi:MAG: DUF4097 family beta strand repeat protein [Candidatus Latescibacteria bacterium]|nr:DUF4097 family beta strand repeat protein [Candidatus Latescibacterota bacterium]
MDKNSYKLLILVTLFATMVSCRSTCELVSLDLRDFKAVSIGGRAKAEAVESKVYPVSHPDKFTFSLKNTNGSIRVSGKPTREISIRAEKVAYGEDQQQAEKHLEELIIVYERKTDELSIRAKPPLVTIGGRSPRVDFIISLPETLRQVNLHSVNGRIDVRHVISSFDLHSTNGAIDLEGSGDMEVSTTNGRIVVRGGSGEIRVSTTNGDINIDANNSEVSASSTNGRIRLKLRSPEQTDAHTTNGDISADIREARSIKVEASARKAWRLYLSGFDKVEKRKGLVQNSASAILGDGKVRMEFRTTNGSIEVRVTK